MAIEQMINEPNAVVVGERIPIGDDAQIVFSRLVYTGKQLKRTNRLGRLDQIVPGQSGGLILGRDGKARYVRIGEEITVVPPDEPED
jgi:hypothetical protein